ncbi:hypothetical protein [Thermofilum sp.]|uniref:hypothetical protein n=1 Tax=Thermofilum sp. TaxID=1961369 RepID=UPI00258AE9D2|nr:hypothetical protein [Thermofilum sp.]
MEPKKPAPNTNTIILTSTTTTTTSPAGSHRGPSTGSPKNLAKRRPINTTTRRHQTIAR